MIKTALSSNSCGLNIPLTFRVAKEIGYSGVEIIPLRNTTVRGIERLVDKYNLPVLSVHGPWWTEVIQNLTIAEGSRHERLEALFWRQKIGAFESNNAAKIAEALNVPMILHPGLVFEIFEQGLESAIENVEIRVENDDSAFHPFTPDKTNGLRAAIAAYDTFGLSGLVLDLEHLAKYERYNGAPQDFISGLNRAISAIGDRNLAEIHICDYQPGVKGGGHLAMGKGRLPLGTSVNRLVEVNANLQFTIEAAGKEKGAILAVLSGGITDSRDCRCRASSFMPLFSEV